MKTAIIFDLDGTILDTLEDLYLSVNEMLKAFGFPLRTRQEVRSFVGNGVPKLVERALPNGTDVDTFDKALCFFKKYYDAHCNDHTKAYPGMNEALIRLRQDGYLLGVVTNKIHTAAQILCKTHFDGLIDEVQGQTGDLSPKPDPASLMLVRDKLSADRVIYVGDSEVDIQTAKNFGAPCVSVTWGFKNRDFLMEHGAVHIADSIPQMLERIYEISKN